MTIAWGFLTAPRVAAHVMLRGEFVKIPDL